MPKATNKMICPKCGAVMNHHANKLVDPADPQEAAEADPELGGLLQETHACPNCGNVEFRRAQ